MPTRVTATAMRQRLAALGNPAAAAGSRRFFKTGKGEYGEGDLFRGIRVPVLRALLREYRGVTLAEASRLLRSRYHEDRLFALMLMVELFRRGDETRQKLIYRNYLLCTRYINNWDLVDSSAEHIVGGWLLSRSRRSLHRLARSRVLWERRIAILATFHFIRRHDFRETLEIARLLRDDQEDLIHKAVGWMLRETGNRNRAAEVEFLQKHCQDMPRTMLRYAIEKFSPADRARFTRRS